MSRVKRGVIAKARKKKILKQTKGFRAAHSKVFKVARERLYKALTYSYRDRKNKKRVFRRLWITRINAAVREKGLKYSEFINKLKKANILIDRKILSELAVNNKPEFDKIIELLASLN